MSQASFKLSQYTVVEELAEQGLPSHLLVFNTMSSRSIAVDTTRWAEVCRHADSPVERPLEVDRDLDLLAGIGIVVPTETNERDSFINTFEAFRHHPQVLSPILAVTTACNIGCTYCYEAGISGKTMSPAVVDGVVRWVRDRAASGEVKTVFATLFGGEPLLYPAILLELMTRISTECAAFGVEADFGCSSNGIRLTAELARQLARAGMRQMQISLDGPECMHDKRRVGKKGQPSFQESLAGIRAAVGVIHEVTVKVNFDYQNIPTIAELFDFLVSEALNDKVVVKLEAIAHQFPDSTVKHDPAVVIDPASSAMADAYASLMLEARDRSIRITRDSTHTTPCMMSSEHGVIIGPDGLIYKCISLVGRVDSAVGSVLNHDMYDEHEYSRQMDTIKKLDDCFDEKCEYVPVCAGGCSYESMVRGGRYDERFCTKPRLKRQHFNRHLLRNHAHLQTLGMRPLTPANIVSGPLRAPGTTLDLTDPVVFDGR